MGQYINQDSKGRQLPDMGKTAKLIEDGAITIHPYPTEFEEDMVCVAVNEGFDAAAYAHCENEFHFLKDHVGDRPHIWLKYPHAKKTAK